MVFLLSHAMLIRHQSPDPPSGVPHLVASGHTPPSTARQDQCHEQALFPSQGEIARHRDGESDMIKCVETRGGGVYLFALSLG